MLLFIASSTNIFICRHKIIRKVWLFHTKDVNLQKDSLALLLSEMNLFK